MCLPRRIPAATNSSGPGIRTRICQTLKSCSNLLPYYRNRKAIGSQDHEGEKGPRFAVCKLGTERSRLQVSFDLCSESGGRRMGAAGRSACEKTGVAHSGCPDWAWHHLATGSLLMGAGDKGKVNRKVGRLVLREPQAAQKVPLIFLLGNSKTSSQTTKYPRHL